MQQYGSDAKYRAVKVRRTADGHAEPILSWPSEGSLMSSEGEGADDGEGEVSVVHIPVAVAAAAATAGSAEGGVEGPPAAAAAAAVTGRGLKRGVSLSGDEEATSQAGVPGGDHLARAAAGAVDEQRQAQQRRRRTAAAHHGVGGGGDAYRSSATLHGNAVEVIYEAVGAPTTALGQGRV